MIRSLTVWWGGEIVGRLALDRHGAMRFTYDGVWVENASAPPISFSLPKRQQRGLGPPFVRRRVAELCDMVEEASHAVMRELTLPGLGSSALANQSELVRARASRLSAAV